MDSRSYRRPSRQIYYLFGSPYQQLGLSDGAAIHWCPWHEEQFPDEEGMVLLAVRPYFPPYGWHSRLSAEAHQHDRLHGRVGKGCQRVPSLHHPRRYALSQPRLEEGLLFHSPESRHTYPIIWSRLRAPSYPVYQDHYSQWKPGGTDARNQALLQGFQGEDSE